MNPDLFSPVLERRLKATLAANPDDLVQSWPAGCRGAANAYAVLLGPSPGAPKWDEVGDPGGAGRPMAQSTAKLGDGFGTYEFTDGKQRNWKWRRLFQCVFGEGDPYTRLTAVWNLDLGHFADEEFVALSAMEDGTKEIFRLIGESRPRVIVTLTKSVNWTFGCAVKALGFPCALVDSPIEIGGSAYEVVLPGVGFKTLVFKTPRHPSRIPLSDTQCEAIRLLVGRYL